MPRVSANTDAQVKQSVISAYDLRPMTVYFYTRTGSDGLLSNFMKAQAFIGSEANPVQAVFSEGSTDSVDAVWPVSYTNVKEVESFSAVCTTVLQRFSMTTFTTNPTRRLPKNTTYRICMRVAIARADKAIRVSIRKIEKCKRKVGGDIVVVSELDHKSLEYRMFRKAAKLLPIAFARLELDKEATMELRKLQRKQQRAEAKTKVEKPQRKARTVKDSPKASKTAKASKPVKSTRVDKPSSDDDFEL